MIRHRMYINGRLDRGVDNANLGLYNYSQYGYLGLGFSGESYLDGLLDEVMVFNQSLTDMQANELSNAQAAEYGRFTVLHDAAGNLTRDHRGYEYEYDYENRMTVVKKPLGAGFVAVATFEYDALGRRIEKVDAIAGTTTRYYYDDQRVAVQTLVSGSVETDDRYFVFGNYIDETLLMHVIPAQAGTQDLYYAHDHLYSPVALFAANGTVAERYEYDAYGKCQILNSEFLILNSSQHGNPYAFTGRELDTLDAGRRTLMYYRARTTDPETGRFMQRDPLGLRVEKYFFPLMHLFENQNLYAYAYDNSINLQDPSGLSPGIEIKKDGSIDTKYCDCRTYAHLKQCEIVDSDWESLQNGHTGFLRYILALLEGGGSGSAGAAGKIADLVASVKFMEARGLWKEEHTWTDYKCVGEVSWVPIKTGKKTINQKGEKVNLDVDSKLAYGLGRKELTEWIEGQLAELEKLARNSIPKECKGGKYLYTITNSKKYDWFNEKRSTLREWPYISILPKE